MHARGLKLLQEPLQHQRAEGQYLAAGTGNVRDPLHGGDLLRPADLLAEGDGLARGQRVAVHDAQGVVRHLHVHAGDGAPRAADGKEVAAATGGEPRHLADEGIRDVEGLVHAVARDVDEAQATERQRHGLAQLLAADIDQF